MKLLNISESDSILMVEGGWKVTWKNADGSPRASAVYDREGQMITSMVRDWVNEDVVATIPAEYMLELI